MNNKQKWFLLIVIALGSCLGVVTAQQMYSGGQAVTVSSGSITATQATGSNLHVQVDTAPSTAVTGTFWQATQPVSGTVSVNALPAGTAKFGITYPYTSCGTTAFSKALQAAPTSSTAIASSTTCLLTLQLSNTTAGALTVTVSDNAGTPINFLNAVTLNAGETREYSFPNGMNFASGIKMTSSGAGITYAAEGLQ